jgi:hypothetical protein
MSELNELRTLLEEVKRDAAIYQKLANDCSERDSDIAQLYYGRADAYRHLIADIARVIRRIESAETP